MNEYDLTLFVREKDNLYRRYRETHLQRAWEPETVKKLIRRAGMELVAVYDAFTRNPPEPESERIYMIAREKGKQR